MTKIRLFVKLLWEHHCERKHYVLNRFWVGCNDFQWLMGSAGLCSKHEGNCGDKMRDCFCTCDTGKFKADHKDIFKDIKMCWYLAK